MLPTIRSGCYALTRASNNLAKLVDIDQKMISKLAPCVTGLTLLNVSRRLPAVAQHAAGPCAGEGGRTAAPHDRADPRQDRRAQPCRRIQRGHAGHQHLCTGRPCRLGLLGAWPIVAANVSTLALAPGLLPMKLRCRESPSVPTWQGLLTCRAGKRKPIFQWAFSGSI